MSSQTAQLGETSRRPWPSAKCAPASIAAKVESSSKPSPFPQVGEGEVLFRVAACGICGTDIKKIQHGFVNPPQIFGHELAGTVVEVGRGVRKFKPATASLAFITFRAAIVFSAHRNFSPSVRVIRRWA